MTYLLRLIADGFVNDGQTAHATLQAAKARGATYTGSRRWWWNGYDEVSVKGRRSAYVTPIAGGKQ